MNATNPTDRRPNAPSEHHDAFIVCTRRAGKGFIQTFLKESAEYLGLKAAIATARARACRQAWKMEQNLVKNGYQGTVRWTSAQRRELLNRGKVRGFSPHHINNVADYPQHAGNPDNIRFVKNHIEAHSGDFQNATSGAFVDRTAGGKLPRMATESGYSIPGTAMGLAAGAMGMAAEALQYLEYADPFFVTDIGGCNDDGQCQDMR